MNLSSSTKKPFLCQNTRKNIGHGGGMLGLLRPAIFLKSVARVFHLYIDIQDWAALRICREQPILALSKTCEISCLREFLKNAAARSTTQGFDLRGPKLFEIFGVGSNQEPAFEKLFTDLFVFKDKSVVG